MNVANKFSCRQCHGVSFELKEMKKEKTMFKNNRGICKPCHSSYNKMHVQIKGAEKNPDNYMSCDSCDRIFSKYQVGAPSRKNHIPQKLKISCPYCNSEDIDSY
jgi:hypothetical protein